MNKLELKSNGQWELVTLLGQGAFGEVHHWRHYKTGQEIATKRLKANARLKPDEINVLKKRWLQELQWLQNCGTAFIVGAASIDDHEFVNYLAQQNHFDNTLPVIIMDYCNGGDLRCQLNNVENLNGLIEYNVRLVLFALLSAIRHLHEVCNIEHRDVKPENIVSHIQGNQRIYKLTDFGYAREIPDSTIAQSVVGTRNYVAPEVIDPGIYTKTVDFYSIGIVAFEITCGVQPFIPHQSFVNRIKCIQSKPPQCIDILQKIDESRKENFEFIKHVKPKNRSSHIFLSGLEKWLQLTLDKDYKTRGFNANNELRFYSDMEAILQKKIVTVFSLKTYRKYCYDINSYASLKDFYQQIYIDNQIEETNIFIFLPPLHPHKTAQMPADYFVPEWCDTDNTDNPPVMLFVGEFLIKPNLDTDEKDHFILSETFKKCMSLYPDDDSVVPLWLLEQFEREVHFIIANEQHLLQCYLMGLQNFIMETENAVFQYKTKIDMLLEKIYQLSGSLKHANVVSYQLLNIQDGQSPKSAVQMPNAMQIQEFQNNYNNLKAIRIKILQNCKELANHKIYHQYPKKDIFNLFKYNCSLSKKYSLVERLYNAQDSFEKCVQGFKIITAGSELINIRTRMKQQIDEFNGLRFYVDKLNQKIVLLENELYEYTRSLIRQTINETTLPLKMSSLRIDGSTSNRSLLNSFDSETTTLINDAENILNAMESTMKE